MRALFFAVKNGATKRRLPGEEKKKRPGIGKPTNTAPISHTMERPSKRMRMSLPPQHPAAVLLDDAFRAFFTKMEAKKHPMRPQPFNAMKELKLLNQEVDSIATHSDASVYAELPYDLQGLVRQFTPHPVSLLLKDALYVWKELQYTRRHWPEAEDLRLRIAHNARNSHVRVAHFEWLQDRNIHGAWDRSGVACGDFRGSEEDPYDPHDYALIISF